MVSKHCFEALDKSMRDACVGQEDYHQIFHLEEKLSCLEVIFNRHYQWFPKVHAKILFLHP